MSIKLAIDNGSKNYNNIDESEIDEVMNLAAGMSFEERTVFFEKVLEPVVPAFNEDIYSPVWLTTHFNENIWVCKWGKNKTKIIDFNIPLDDNSLLTEPKNIKLLFTIKYWLCLTSHSRYCGGSIPKSSTTYQKVNNTLQLIDLMLLNSKKLSVSEFGFSLLNENDIYAMLGQIEYGVVDGAYGFSNKVTEFLRSKTKQISESEIEAAAIKYPQIYHEPYEYKLNLSQSELVKSRVWLLNNNAYLGASSKSNRGNCENKIFLDRFFKNTLHGKNINADTFPELRITPFDSETEYNRVPVNTSEAEKISSGTLSRYINLFKLNLVMEDEKFLSIPADSLKNISVRSIREHSNEWVQGRFRSLPAPVVMDTLRNSFEFCFKYMDDILEAVHQLLTAAPSLPRTRDGKKCWNQSLDREVNRVISKQLKSIGINSWRIKSEEHAVYIPEDYYHQLRNNNGLANLFDVLMGSTLIIIGTMMARRSGEIIDLKPDCLIPNTNPYLEENKDTGYFLVFDNRKSGDDEDREQLSRPIMQSGAKLIWKFIKFREKLQSDGIVSKKSKLFVSLSKTKVNCESIKSNAYNNYLDSCCDYFETHTININNEPHRFYIRQHQLRRFFAMSFFWGSGFDGLDTLRYFLGHTDAEHLYHYITESTSGVVLRGVKVDTIVHGLNAGNIENIEKLREILCKRLGVSSIQIQEAAEAIELLEDDVEDGFIITEPPIEKLQYQLEQDINQLLVDGIIDLEPEFLTVSDNDGDTTQQINLILKISEVENGY